MNQADVFKFMLKLPGVINGATSIIEMIKDSPDGEKKAAIKSAIMASVSLAEYTVDKDFLNDAAIAQLIDVYADAELAVHKAKDALKKGLLNRKK